MTSVEGESIDRTHALVWHPSSPGTALFQQIAQDMRGSIDAELSAQASVLPGP